MPNKPDPFARMRPKRKVWGPKEFVEEEGISISLCLRALDVPEQAAAIERIDQLARLYLGDEDEKTPGIPFPPVGGEVIQVSKPLIQMAVWLEAMQVEHEESVTYNAEQWIAVSVTMPNIWRQVQAAVKAVQRDDKDALKNVFGEDTGASSAPPSGSVPSTTLSS